MISLKLIFKNSYGQERVIANPRDEKEAMKEINKFVDECNAKRTDGKKFEIYYIRSWEHNGRKTFDVGSHTEFFYLENDSEV